MGSAIQIIELTKDFPLQGRGKYLRAVDHLSLTIERNSVFGLLGPNGSGKSTTIKILLGLSRASSGRCEIFGEGPDSRATRARIGYLPDAPYYYRFLTGFELLELYGKLLGVKRAERRRRNDALLDRFGLADAKHRKLGSYSKGMLQRLGFAQTLLNDPEVLVLDEPTAGVDPIGAAEVGDFIREMKREGKTVLLCSHLLSQVQDVCDRVGIMNQGRLLAEGAVDELLDKGEPGGLLLRGLDSATLASVEAAVADGVGQLSRSGLTLEQLFRKLVEEDARNGAER